MSNKIEFLKIKNFTVILIENLRLYYETGKFNFTDDYKKYLEENGTLDDTKG